MKNYGDKKEGDQSTCRKVVLYQALPPSNPIHETPKRILYWRIYSRASLTPSQNAKRQYPGKQSYSEASYMT